MRLQGLVLSIGDIISAVTAVGVVIALINNARKMRAESWGNNPALIGMRSDVEHIRQEVDKLGMRMARLDEKIDGMSERLVIVEQSTKAAHKRLDDMRKGI